MQIETLYRDAFIAVVNKPCGLMVEDDQYGHPSVMQELKKEWNAAQHKNFFLQNIHRLDRPVSGALALAFKPSIVKKWSHDFRTRNVEKHYFALVMNAPPQPKGKLQHWLWKNQREWCSVVKANPFPDAKPVELDYEVKATVGATTLLDVHLHSGKYHQIRAQLAFIGCPIIGDEKYGSSVSFAPGAIGLHAHTLEFKHPARGNRVEIKAAVPVNDWWQKFAAML
ncbi:MAG: RNA pseudouridine synthase [Chitinophagales bacterium]